MKLLKMKTIEKGKVRKHVKTLPKRLFSPMIFRNICLINEGNSTITYTMMFVIFKISVKWRLFDGIPFNETPMGWLVIAKFRSKTQYYLCIVSSTLCMKKDTLLQQWFKLSGLIEYSFCVLKDLNVSVVTTFFAYFAPSTSACTSVQIGVLLKEEKLHT